EAVCDASAHQLLGTLIEHMPSTVHVVIASRTPPPFPLARLRVRGHLAEIGPDDLRFRTEEATSLVAQGAASHLPAHAVRTPNDRLEGWTSLLGLVALRLDQISSADGRVRAPCTLADSAGPEVALRQQADRDIDEFLNEEILDVQPREVQRLMLR